MSVEPTQKKIHFDHNPKVPVDHRILTRNVQQIQNLILCSQYGIPLGNRGLVFTIWLFNIAMENPL